MRVLLGEQDRVSGLHHQGLLVFVRVGAAAAIRRVAGMRLETLGTARDVPRELSRLLEAR